MDDVILNNGDEIIIPQGADGTEPLTPEIPIVDPDNPPIVNELPNDDVVNPIDGVPVVDAPVVSAPDEDEKVDDTQIKIGEFFGTLQESVTIAWRYHLKTRKHHIHMALQEYYYGAMGIVDAIIEEYQGSTGVIIDNYFNTVCECGKTEVEYFQDLKSVVSTSKSVLMFESEIGSKIDDLLGLIDTTLYKLTSFCEHNIKTFDEFCFENYEAIGVEGGVDGVFDTVTKTTKTNVVPDFKTHNKCKDCEDCGGKCDDDEDDEEEE